MEINNDEIVRQLNLNLASRQLEVRRLEIALYKAKEDESKARVLLHGFVKGLEKEGKNE